MHTLPPALDTGKKEGVDSPMLQTALQYAARGWQVIPLHTPTTDGCSCLQSDCSVGKHPRTHNGSKGASSDETQIRRWWRMYPDANIGIATGAQSRLCVLDIDGEDGQASLTALGTYGQLPCTLQAFTGRKGLDGKRTGAHFYFAYPVGSNLRNSQGRLGKGLDLRACGGYVVAPPSLHTSGLKYEWVDEGKAIAELPTWFIARASQSTGAPVLTLETDILYDGERDVRLYRLAAKWRREGASQDELYAHLQAINLRACKPPVGDSQILKIARSAAHLPIGGPDPLELAWEKANAEKHYYVYDKILALIRHLEEQRPGHPILLPVERISKLIDCDPTLVSRYRRRAIKQGLIREVEKSIPHKKATRFMVVVLPQAGFH